MQEWIRRFQDAVVDEAGAVNAECDEAACTHEAVGTDHGTWDDAAGVGCLLCQMSLQSLVNRYFAHFARDTYHTVRTE